MILCVHLCKIPCVCLFRSPVYSGVYILDDIMCCDIVGCMDVIATHVSCVYLRCIIMCVDHYACDILLGVYNTAPVGLGVCV